ncbi:hypothetical protein PGT21_015264 [Puccinia graminis f. sp. tritici]|uniref:Uncharacterized protein n=1 Tax=Puccinia graminis f. sp. tritici TaxID=56615 RepID=A0A5B0NJH9_PUCGR|nr:hypothetical protein PGT21_015264 [Puccinia graminis f. sp. tritici]KAA1087979.1 hypothetical protein PGTUg99_012565 [Puccinia graminis f. sp. tritici]
MLLKSSDPPLATSSSTDLENSSQNNNLGSLQRKAISSTSLTSSHLKKFVSRIDARKIQNSVVNNENQLRGNRKNTPANLKN